MLLVERLLHRVQLAVGARPSIVVTSVPSACTASTVHDFTDSPSSSTVQAPHDDVSQPTLVPLARGRRAGSARAASRLDVRLAPLAVDRQRDVGHAFASWSARHTFSALQGMST